MNYPHYKFNTVKKPSRGYWGFCLLIAATLTLSWVVSNEEKKYKVELPMSQWNKHNNGFNAIAGYLRNSNLPAKDVSYIQDSILTPFQIELATQIGKQLDTVGKKPK